MKTNHDEIFASTKSELAARLGLSRSTVYTYIQRGLLPETGPWEVSDCLARIEEHRTANDSDSDGKEEKLALECERLKGLILIEAERLKQAKFETAKQAGLIVEKSEVLKAVDSLIADFRAALQSWEQFQSAKYPDHAAVFAAAHVDAIRTVESGLRM